MENKGIIVTGGAFKAKNVVVGNNAMIVGSDGSKKEPIALPAEMLAKINNWKVELAKGKLKEVIDSMLAHYAQQTDKDTLNAIIMQSAALTQLEMQENMNVLSHEQAKIDRAKITNVVLTLIDSHCV